MLAGSGQNYKARKGHDKYKLNSRETLALTQIRGRQNGGSDKSDGPYLVGCR